VVVEVAVGRGVEGRWSPCCSLLLITAWSPVLTSGAAYSSIVELTLGRTKRRTLIQVITIYPNDIKKEKYYIYSSFTSIE